MIEEVEALRSGDFETFKEKVIESGQSSFMYNQNVYTPRLPKEQPIALALQLTEQMLRGKGACACMAAVSLGRFKPLFPMIA